MNEQADLSEVKDIHGKDAKANFVFGKLQQTANQSQHDLCKYLDEQNIAYQKFYIVNMISLKADKALIETLASRSDVRFVAKDGRMVKHEIIEDRGEGGNRTTTWGVQKIKADSVWLLGYNGQNVVIGGQDTGYDWDHPAIINKYRGWNGTVANHNFNWHDAIHTLNGSNVCGVDSPEPCDDHNHGTHTMGTMTGDDGAGNQIGVAPGAKWIGCRNMDNGDGVLSTYVECFEWFLAPYPVGGNSSSGDITKAPHVINNSWGCPPSEGCNTSNFAIMDLAMNNLRSSGVVVVVSAGNAGSACSTVNDPPAIFEKSFSIGATNSVDAIAGFSSRGHVTIDGSGRLKPNVCGPGVSVFSCVRNGGFDTYSGTSMAGPHVAGAVALIISANPNLAGEVDQIEAILEETAVHITSTQTCGSVNGVEIPNATFGWGRIDALAAVKRAQAVNYVPNIKIDQFGYKPSDQKIAVLSNPITGYNNTYTYTPSATIKVKNAITHATVLSAAPTIWNTGATHTASGDKAWWFDFSALITPGTYYISDGGRRSEDFEISETVYDQVLSKALKTFYYQRCGVAKSSTFVPSYYADAVCHSQDATCRFINDPNNASLYKNMSGGWHDAGDYNKYINFTYATLLDLLNAYEYNPETWTDAMDLPESGNGIPDVLDEIKYELDWMIKMQDVDGGVFSVVGVQNYAEASPPSADAATRYYGPKTTSASLTTAVIFAYAARQFKKLNNSTAQAYATTLRTKAEAAYNWAVANPIVVYHNLNIIAAGEQEISVYERDMRKICAAAYLYSLTGTATYKTFVETNYTNAHMFAWSFVYPFEVPTQQGILFYASIPNVTAAVRDNIINTYKNAIDTNGDNYPAYTNKNDPYRAHIATNNYVWGSNGWKCSMANSYQSYVHFNLDLNKNADMKKIMDGFIHYMHGVNPNALCYLTNMEDYGAARSVNTIYHAWFKDSSTDWDDVRTSTYGPPPGFIPGGPNPSWGLDACCSTDCGSPQANSQCVNQIPPASQPAMKSYKDWNTGWPQNSWSVTETSIYVQAAYLCLLSTVVSKASSTVSAQAKVVVDVSDISFMVEGNSLVLTSANNSYFKLGVDGNGNVVASSIANLINTKSRILTSNLEVKPAYKGIIIVSTGRTYRIHVDNGGNLLADLIADAPSTAVKQITGELAILDNNKGLILRDNLNQCYLLKVNDSGVVYTEAIKCGS